MYSLCANSIALQRIYSTYVRTYIHVCDYVYILCMHVLCVYVYQVLLPIRIVFFCVGTYVAMIDVFNVREVLSLRRWHSHLIPEERYVLYLLCVQ